MDYLFLIIPAPATPVNQLRKFQEAIYSECHGNSWIFKPVSNMRAPVSVCFHLL